MKGVEHLLNTRSILNPPTLYIFEALHLLLDCNSFIFKNKFELLIESTRKTHQKVSNCFGIEKDTRKFNCSQLPMGQAVSVTFTAKSSMNIENTSLF